MSVLRILSHSISGDSAQQTVTQSESGVCLTAESQQCHAKEKCGCSCQPFPLNWLDNSRLIKKPSEGKYQLHLFAVCAGFRLVLIILKLEERIGVSYHCVSRNTSLII